MIALREIVSRDIFKNFEIPEEFGDEFEMILLPIEDRELRMKNERYFDEMSDKERWEKFGKWSDDDYKECILESNRYIFKQMDEEYGEEDYKLWQK